MQAASAPTARPGPAATSGLRVCPILPQTGARPVVTFLVRKRRSSVSPVSVAGGAACARPVPLSDSFWTQSQGWLPAAPPAASVDTRCPLSGHPADLADRLLPSAVVRGAIQNVTHEPERQESAIHLRVSRVYRQKSRVFRAAPEGEGGGWRGRVRTLLECGVRPGPGDFLFTGHMHFGEARLGCAPRFEDFRRVYRDAEGRGLNPCEMGVE